MRPEAGLYAALGAMIAYALFTSTPPHHRRTRHDDRAARGLRDRRLWRWAIPARAAELAAALALMTGALLVVAGRAAARQRRRLLSTPVLVGYADGAALMLIGTQLPVLLGVPVPRDAFFLRVFDVPLALPQANVATLDAGRRADRDDPAARSPGAARARGADRVRASRSWRRVALDLPARGVVHLRRSRRRFPRRRSRDVTARPAVARARRHCARAARVRGGRPAGAHARREAPRGDRSGPAS